MVATAIVREETPSAPNIMKVLGERYHDGVGSAEYPFHDDVLDDCGYYPDVTKRVSLMRSRTPPGRVVTATPVSAEAPRQNSSKTLKTPEASTSKAGRFWQLLHTQPKLSDAFFKAVMANNDKLIAKALGIIDLSPDDSDVDLSKEEVEAFMRGRTPDGGLEITSLEGFYVFNPLPSGKVFSLLISSVDNRIFWGPVKDILSNNRSRSEVEYQLGSDATVSFSSTAGNVVLSFSRDFDVTKGTVGNGSFTGTLNKVKISGTQINPPVPDATKKTTKPVKKTSNGAKTEINASSAAIGPQTNKGGNDMVLCSASFGNETNESANNSLFVSNTSETNDPDDDRSLLSNITDIDNLDDDDSETNDLDDYSSLLSDIADINNLDNVSSFFGNKTNNFNGNIFKAYFAGNTTVTNNPFNHSLYASILPSTTGTNNFYGDGFTTAVPNTSNTIETNGFDFSPIPDAVLKSIGVGAVIFALLFLCKGFLLNRSKFLREYKQKFDRFWVRRVEKQRLAMMEHDVHFSKDDLKEFERKTMEKLREAIQDHIPPGSDSTSIENFINEHELKKKAYDILKEIVKSEVENQVKMIADREPGWLWKDWEKMGGKDAMKKAPVIVEKKVDSLMENYGLESPGIMALVQLFALGLREDHKSNVDEAGKNHETALNAEKEVLEELNARKKKRDLKLKENIRRIKRDYKRELKDTEEGMLLMRDEEHKKLDEEISSLEEKYKLKKQKADEAQVEKAKAETERDVHEGKIGIERGKVEREMREHFRGE